HQRERQQRPGEDDRPPALPAAQVDGREAGAEQAEEDRPARVAGQYGDADAGERRPGDQRPPLLAVVHVVVEEGRASRQEQQRPDPGADAGEPAEVGCQQHHPRGDQHVRPEAPTSVSRDHGSSPRRPRSASREAPAAPTWGCASTRPASAPGRAPGARAPRPGAPKVALGARAGKGGTSYPEPGRQGEGRTSRPAAPTRALRVASGLGARVGALASATIGRMLGGMHSTETAFLEAVKAGDLAQVTRHVDDEPSLLDARPAGAPSAALLAVYHGHPEVAEALVERGATVSVFEAAALGLSDVLSALLDEEPAAVD